MNDLHDTVRVFVAAAVADWPTRQYVETRVLHFRCAGWLYASKPLLSDAPKVMVVFP